MAATTRMKGLVGCGSTPEITGASIAWATIRAPGPATQLGHAADMVGMPMRQQDRVHLADSALGVLDDALDLVGPSGNPGVDQHYAVVDDNGKKH